VSGSLPADAQLQTERHAQRLAEPLGQRVIADRVAQHAGGRLGAQPADRHVGPRRHEREPRDQPDERVHRHQALHGDVVVGLDRAEGRREARRAAQLHQRGHRRAALASDPQLAGQVGDIDLRGRGERMIGRQAQQHRVLADQAAWPAGLEVVEHRRVDPAGREQRPRLLRLGIDHADRESVRRAGDDRGGRGRERRHAQSRRIARQRVEPAARLRQLAQRDVGVADEEPAGVGQLGAARPALHQPDSRLALEQRDLLRDRRRRVVERERSGAERAAAGDLGQHAQAVEVHGRYMTRTAPTCRDPRTGRVATGVAVRGRDRERSPMLITAVRTSAHPRAIGLPRSRLPRKEIRCCVRAWRCWPSP
jgi:hypothetical protein